MSDLSERLRQIERNEPPALWEEISLRGRVVRRRPERSPSRIVTAVVAIVIAAAGVVVVVRAFRPNGTAVPADVPRVTRVDLGIEWLRADMTSGGGAIWTISTSPDYRYQIARVDEETLEVSRFPLGLGDEDGAVGGLAYGHGSVWVSLSPVHNGSYDVLRGAVLRIDPATGDVLTRTVVGRNPTGVAAGEGGVWVANEADDSITRIDPSTNDVVDTIPAGNGPRWLALGFGSLWVETAFGTPAVYRIDPLEGRVTGVFRDVTDLTLGDEVAWVLESDGPSNVVRQIDPETNAITDRRVPFGAEPLFVAAGEGQTWIGAFFPAPATPRDLVIPGPMRPGDSKAFRVDPETMEPLRRRGRCVRTASTPCSHRAPSGSDAGVTWCGSIRVPSRTMLTSGPRAEFPIARWRERLPRAVLGEPAIRSVSRSP